MKKISRLLVESKNAVTRFAAELCGLAALREIILSFFTPSRQAAKVLFKPGELSDVYNDAKIFSLSHGRCLD
ncbi:MAG: hypothetical protein Q4G59_12725 [Planctomycetia bacterium]|nr:hypothetical protein [Planctomycetia bacterium]